MNVGVADHYNSVAETYFQQYQRASLSSHGTYPANYFRLQIFVQRLAELRLNSVYEVGVGEGTPLATMAAMGFRVGGLRHRRVDGDQGQGEFRFARPS